MYREKSNSIMFAISSEKDGKPVLSSKQEKALAFGAAHIYLVLLILRDKKPSGYHLLAKNINMSKFINLFIYESSYSEIPETSKSDSYLKLLKSKPDQFVLGDHRNFLQFKHQFKLNTGATFEDSEYIVLSNFIYQASKARNLRFKFSRASNKEGPVALFWLWYFNEINKPALKYLHDSKILPAKVIDKISLLDATFMALKQSSPGFQSHFERRGSNQEYLLKRCHISYDLCTHPIRARFTSESGDESHVYVNYAELEQSLELTPAESTTVTFSSGRGRYTFAVSSDGTLAVDQNIRDQYIDSLRIFKSNYTLKFNRFNQAISSKDALAIMDLYYSIFEAFGFQRDRLPALSLNLTEHLPDDLDNDVRPDGGSRCIIL